MVGAESATDRTAQARALRLFLLAEVTAHAWVVVLQAPPTEIAGRSIVWATALTLVAAAGWIPRLLGAATRAAFVVLGARLVATAPEAYNHLVLETILMGAAALGRSGDEEEDLLFLQLARWVVALVLLWSGLQKLLHGCWFRGEFLALAVATNAHFAEPFSWIAPDDVARLQALLPLRPGGGPFLVTSPLFAVAANLVWVSEIAGAILLLVPRTRGLAVVLTLGLLLGIEAIARELVFGVLFAGGVLLFAPGRTFARALPILLGLLAGILALHWTLPEAWLN